MFNELYYYELELDELYIPFLMLARLPQERAVTAPVGLTKAMLRSVGSCANRCC